jgi:hypothetical protein
MVTRFLLTCSLVLAGCSGDSTLVIPDAEPPLPPIDAAIELDAPPAFYLSETGLYSNIADKIVAPEAVEFLPAFELWTDAAVKRRWILLPPGQTIDTTDMDHWIFPVGTKVFKEFVRDDVLVETRLIWRRGDNDYFLGAFIWDSAETDAIFVPDGEENAGGTAHDVPATGACVLCHMVEPGRVLAFSAIQLSRPGPELNLEELVANKWLSDDPPPDTTYPVVGRTAEEIAAFGYMHANCGHCHATGGSAFEIVPSLTLRLATAETDPVLTAIYTTSVDIDLQHWIVNPYYIRVVSGDSAASGYIARMDARGPELVQMPPLGTEDKDTAGLAAMAAWIDHLEVP